MNYTQDEYKRANYLAETLRDQESLQSYLKFVRTFSEKVLLETLTRVMSVPDDKIRKTRGALFTYLLRAKSSHDHYSRH